MAQPGRAADSVVRDAEPDTAQVEQVLATLERARPATGSRLAWVLVVIGLLAIVGLGIHGYTAYATIARIDVDAKISTGNPLQLFSTIATNGPQVGSSVASSSRATYTKALNQFALDGTGVLVGFVVVVAGLFIRSNL